MDQLSNSSLESQNSVLVTDELSNFNINKVYKQNFNKKNQKNFIKHQNNDNFDVMPQLQTSVW